MERYLDLTKQGNGQGGILVDIGSYQYNFHGKVLPIITVEKAKEIFTAYLNGQHVCLKWNIYNALFNYLNVVSADYVNNEYSIDVLVHNRYHISYTWTDEQEGMTTIEVEEFPVDIIQNFLPDGTIITVKQDGTGDFNDIQTAINSLDGKYSNGVVTVEIGAGEYPISSTIDIPTCNIPRLSIVGSANFGTVLKVNYDATTFINEATINNDKNCELELSDLYIKGVNRTERGINGANNSKIIIKNIKIENCNEAVVSGENSDIFVKTAITCQNCTKGMYATLGSIKICYKANLIFSNVTTGLQVSNGGTIAFNHAIKTFNSVTNQTSQSIGTANANGYITGSWS